MIESASSAHRRPGGVLVAHHREPPRERVELAVPHLRRGAERVGQHQRRRALRSDHGQVQGHTGEGVVPLELGRGVLREAHAPGHPQADLVAGHRAGQRRHREQPALVERELEPDAVLERDRPASPARAAAPPGRSPRGGRGRAGSRRCAAPACRRSRGTGPPRRSVGARAARAGRPVGDQASLEQHQQPVGQSPRLGSVVDYHQRRRGPRAQRGSGVVEHRRPRGRVEAGERLVEQQHVGAHRHRPAPGARAVARRPTACLPCGRSGDRPSSPPAPPAARSRRWARGTPHQPSASSTLAVTVRRARSGDCSASATRPERVIAPAGGCKRSRQRLQQRALTGAVGAEYGDELAGPQLEAHVADHLTGAAADAQVLAAQHRISGHGGHPHIAGAVRNRSRNPPPWCWSRLRLPISNRIRTISTSPAATAYS